MGRAVAGKVSYPLLPKFREVLNATATFLGVWRVLLLRDMHLFAAGAVWAVKTSNLNVEQRRLRSREERELYGREGKEVGRWLSLCLYTVERGGARRYFLRHAATPVAGLWL